MQKGQAERLMPLLEEVLTKGGAEWRDLSTLGVGIGPGNFTGIRISVSAARGLALALGIPAVGVSRFEAEAVDMPRPIASLIDARRGQVYLQFLQHGGVEPPHLLPRAEADAMIAARKVEAVGLDQSDPAVPLATGIARLAQQRSSLNPGRPAPLYIRAVDAAPPRDPAPVILP